MKQLTSALNAIAIVSLNTFTAITPVSINTPRRTVAIILADEAFVQILKINIQFVMRAKSSKFL